jgi:hypothetical protein
VVSHARKNTAWVSVSADRAKLSLQRDLRISMSDLSATLFRSLKMSNH